MISSWHNGRSGPRLTERAQLAQLAEVRQLALFALFAMPPSFGYLPPR